MAAYILLVRAVQTYWACSKSDWRELAEGAPFYPQLQLLTVEDMGQKTNFPMPSTITALCKKCAVLKRVVIVYQVF